MWETNRKYLIIIAFSLVFVFLIFMAALMGMKKGSESRPGATVTPARVQPTAPVPETAPLSLVSTSPNNGAEAVGLDTNIELRFNRTPRASELTISLVENLTEQKSYRTRIIDNKLVVIPDTPLAESSVYRVTVRRAADLELIGEVSFLTLTTTVREDTRPVELVTQIEERSREERPDIYLANKMPYDSADFRMDLEIDEVGNFTFVVTSNKYTGGLLVNRVNQWLQSIGLTVEQIEDLEFAYR